MIQVQWVCGSFVYSIIYYHKLSHCLSFGFLRAHVDSAGHYFEQSLNAYRNSAGPHDPAFLTAQDDFCRFLLFSGQQEVTNIHTRNDTHL